MKDNVNPIAMDDSELTRRVDERSAALVAEASEHYNALCEAVAGTPQLVLAHMGFLFRKVAGLQVALEMLAEDEQESERTT